MIPKSGNRFSEKIMLARMSIARGYRLIALLALTLVGSAMPAHAQSDDERYSIMRPEKPEPWLAPKYKSPRGTRQHVVIPRPAPAPQRRTAVPPPIYVPQTGQVLPNLPAISGSGPRGALCAPGRSLRPGCRRPQRLCRKLY